MSERLYSDSPYLLILTITVFLLSLAFPWILKRRLSAKQIPKVVRTLTILGIIWNFCSVVGIIAFSGEIETGSIVFQLRQVLFGIQALMWVQMGAVLYSIGEQVSFHRLNRLFNFIRIFGCIMVVLLTGLFILRPHAFNGFGVERFEFIASHPIFVSYTVIFLVFNFPILIASCYQMIKNSLNISKNGYDKINLSVAVVFCAILALVTLFDFIMPLFADERFWIGQYLLWHQFAICFVSIICAQYYTSVKAQNKGAHWFLQKLMSKMDEGIIYFDNMGKINFVNGGACKLLGLKTDEIRGKSIRSIFPPNLDFFREIIYNNIKLTINGVPHRLKIHFFRSRQTLSTVTNIAYFTDLSKTLLLQQDLTTLKNQYVEYTHDLVRYQKRINDEKNIKAEKENILNTLINALPFRVWYKSEKGVYQKQNKLDLNRRGALDGIIDPPEKENIYEKNAREKGEAGAYTSYENKDGEEISLDESNKLTKNGEPIQTFDNMFIPIIHGKPPYKTICIMVDMTKQRRLEQERNMLREQKFIHSRLEELGTMCGAFAHDYNNILGAQLGFLQLALEILPKEHQAYMFITEALKAGERGKTSLNELLGTIRGQANTATPAIVFAPYMIIEDVVKKISLTLPPNIQVESENLDHSIKISGIVASLDRIISNLTNNAIFAMKDKGGTLTFKLSSQTLTEQLILPYVPPIPPGEYARISVADTGIGMDSGTLERVFAPFFTTKAPGEGLGLGLSSALRLLKEGNAYFTVQTTLGKGTTFELYWPKDNEKKEDSCPQS